MNNAEFIEYLATPNDDWMKGIATVRLYGKIILRFKIVNKKDDSGYFIAPANFRVSEGDQYRYLDSCLLDSRMENDELMKMIRHNVNRFMEGNKPQEQQQPAEQNFQPNLDSSPF